jgi:hypothetical protein
MHTEPKRCYCCSDFEPDEFDDLMFGKCRKTGKTVACNHICTLGEN